MKHTLILVPLVICLCACTEEPQTINSGKRPDTAAFNGTGMAFVAPGWKQGDKTSWDQQLRTRLQTGQNDYAKVN